MTLTPASLPAAISAASASSRPRSGASRPAARTGAAWCRPIAPRGLPACIWVRRASARVARLPRGPRGRGPGHAGHRYDLPSSMRVWREGIGSSGGRGGGSGSGLGDGGNGPGDGGRGSGGGDGCVIPRTPKAPRHPARDTPVDIAVTISCSFELGNPGSPAGRVPLASPYGIGGAGQSSERVSRRVDRMPRGARRRPCPVCAGVPIIDGDGPM